MHALNEIPNVRIHLYKTNKQGWFPLFRILNFFASGSYNTLKT